MVAGYSHLVCFRGFEVKFDVKWAQMDLVALVGGRVGTPMHLGLSGVVWSCLGPQ